MAEWNWDKFGDDDDDQDDEENTYQKWQWGTKDGLIFLIDCSKSMFEKEGDESPFELCIKCAKSVIQNKIISSDKDLLGIIFFATEKSKNSSEFKHIYVLHELDLPGADGVLRLDAFLEEDENDDFKTKFGHSDSYSLGDALWTCLNMFSNSSQKLGYKRVMIFTNDDNPHGSATKAQLKRQAAAKAEDLHQNGIALELMHINKPDHQFEVNTFYKDILFPDEDENVIMPNPSEKFEELLTRVRSKDHKKRAMGRVPFCFGGDVNMSVGVYNLVRPCTRPPPVKLYKKTNEEVKTVTKMFLAETGEVLMPQDMKKTQTYAGRRILFEQEEVKEIKRFDSSGLKLMGFKPRSSIKKYFHVKPGQFLYPDETTIQGSTTIFTALLKKTLEKDVVAICRYIPRRNTAPRFVALYPQEEEMDDQNVQVIPPGFHLIWLPFADDFRKLKLGEEVPKANTEQIDKAKELVKKLMFSFDSEQFENPALQTHYANVEAMALDKDAPEEVEDLTTPDVERIDRRAGKLIQEFKDLVFPDGYVPGAKRRAAGGGLAAKKPKLNIEIDVAAEAKAGRLNKLTIPVLKEYMKKARIMGVGTRKADLVEAINSHLEID